MTTRGKLAAANGLLAFLLLAPFFLQFRLLWDGDSYFHLALARHYRTEGIFSPAPWGRFSLTSQGGDRDLLYQVLLMPFTIGDAATGGRLALAALNALLIATLTFVFARRERWWAVALPWWLYLTAPPFFVRIVRLRADVLGLILLLLVCEMVARHRFALAGILAAVYTLSYTAFHLMLGLAVIWFVVRRIESGSWQWKLPSSIFAGVAVGLLIRPYPLANLRLWYAQNVQLFQHLDQLDIGEELTPPHLVTLLPLIVGWLAGFAALWLATRRQSQPVTGKTAVSSQEWLTYAITLVVFLVLYARMSKMAIYVYPLAMITLLRWRASRGQSIAQGTPLAIALLVSIGLAFPAMAHPTLRRILGLEGDVATETDLEAFGRRVPKGARIAATWGDAETYAFWAPQGRYLNVYDPTFMYIPFPREWAAQDAVFSGREPDIPRALSGPLQSDYIAFDSVAMSPVFLDRVHNDPRLRVVYGGYNVLLAVVPAPVFAIGTGFVDVPSSDCATIRHVERGPSRLEFAPWGRGATKVDGVPALTIARPQGAVLGRGARIDLGAGEHVLELTTCAAGGRNGFYLVRRAR